MHCINPLLLLMQMRTPGSDVVGRVNCTTYVHMSLGTVVELGHGSGGGISFRAAEKVRARARGRARTDRRGGEGIGERLTTIVGKGEVRWAWEDGLMEIQDGLACKALAEHIFANGGNRGVPTYRLFNRYNREFWIADRSQEENIVYRNALNPVELILHRRGFTFLRFDR